MDRLACVDLPSLPLQLLMRRHRDWRGQAVAVVDRDRPQGLILWVNERARTFGVLPGQRYATALSLCGGLRAGECTASEIATCIDECVETLRRFSPEVEAAQDEPGVFWIDAAGLGSLYPSLDSWGKDLRVALRKIGLFSTLVIGYRRFESYAIAKASRVGLYPIASAEREQILARAVPLDRLALEPKVRDSLARLSIRTVGQLAALPEAGILRRYGARAHRLHQMASGSLSLPLSPRVFEAPIECTVELDEAERDRERLLFVIKRALDPLLADLATRSLALSQLTLTLSIEKAADETAVLRPAQATLDAVQLLGLVTLRLEHWGLTAGVVSLKLRVDGIAASRDQLELFLARPKRDLDSAARALARVRAAYGDQTVVRAVLREGHLPEAQFTWDPIDRLQAPTPRELRDGKRTLVRRFLMKPTALVGRAHERDGWLLNGFDAGPVERFIGPYLVSGGWWRTEITRAYYFAELRSGLLLWVYYDERRRRWLLQGVVS